MFRPLFVLLFSRRCIVTKSPMSVSGCGCWGWDGSLLVVYTKYILLRNGTICLEEWVELIMFFGCLGGGFRRTVLYTFVAHHFFFTSLLLGRDLSNKSVSDGSEHRVEAQDHRASCAKCIRAMNSSLLLLMFLYSMLLS